jgi:3-oxoadipate enol-lactonase
LSVGALVGMGAGDVWVEDTGGVGVPIVLLHPGIADSTIWDRLVPLLDGRRVIRYDLPGYGRSPRPGSASRPVDDLLGVLDALGVERAHLVGNSLGGGTTLALATTAPERVASVTLLCSAVPGFPWPADSGDEDTDAEYERLSEAGDVPGVTDIYLRVFAACGTDAYLRTQVRATTELELSGADLAERNPPVWDAAAKIAVAATVVIGERDDADTTLSCVALADRIPGAELVRLDVDHLPQYRDPEAVAEVILATLARAS